MTDPIQPEPILQTTLRETPWTGPANARLPGTGPVKPGDWLRFDEVYDAQMALRDRLIAMRRETVHAMLPQAVDPARELLRDILKLLAGRPDFSVQNGTVRRPDGENVIIDADQPLLTLGRLVQQDLCILQRQGVEHFLTGAILCFPASWSLDEKMGRPLTAIHEPVAPYSEDIALRVQRLFDAIRPEHPLWRVNLLHYDDADLHQPRSETIATREADEAAPFVRSERQCISRLAETGAIVFAIHTVIVRRSTLSPDDQKRVAQYRVPTA